MSSNPMRAFLFGTALTALLCAAHAQAQPAPSPSMAGPEHKEGTGTGSGSSGMAPQQGTGSGATQHAPGANRPEPNRPPSAADSQQNRDYGRDTSPDGQPMHQSNPAGGTAKPN
ncbi:hypothetical protein [Bosea sp. 2RAB26]|uniref:hypothetical protein n=1 Tax=Bosea sp. 2RAB26 TaxID=3237476 RepID=UPI003F8DF8D1